MISKGVKSYEAARRARALLCGSVACGVRNAMPLVHKTVGAYRALDSNTGHANAVWVAMLSRELAVHHSCDDSPAK